VFEAGPDIPDSVVVDSFEDGGFSEYNGQTAEFGTTITQAYSGVRSAIKTGSDENHAGIYLSSAQFSDSESKTVAIRYYYDGSNHRGGVYLADSSTGAGYVGYVDPTTYTIARVSDSGTYDSKLADSNGAPISAGNWYHAILSHDGGDGVTARLEDDSGATIAGPLSVSDASTDPDTVGIWMFDQDMILDDLAVLS
jgi:hypothetical protein